MREGIRQKLISAIPGIGERIYDPNAASAETVKPYMVVLQGEETEESDWVGFRRIVEVWPNLARTNFFDLDTLCDQVTAALDGQLITDPDTGEVFTCSYQGVAGQDHTDADWDIITRGLRFAVLALQPVAVQETYADDPWLAALASWTETELGQDWTVYRGRWPAGYYKPSVLWRLSEIRIAGRSGAAYEVRKVFVGHVLGSTPNEQLQGVTALLQGLGGAVKLPLDIADRRYMTIGDKRADLKADALRAGQITLELYRTTLRPRDEVPLMAAVHSNGGVRGG